MYVHAWNELCAHACYGIDDCYGLDIFASYENDVNDCYEMYADVPFDMYVHACYEIPDHACYENGVRAWFVICMFLLVVICIL